MKLFPYYKRSVQSSLTEDQVLKKLKDIFSYHLHNNFPDKKDFVGGKIINKQFIIYKSIGAKQRPFSVSSSGRFSNGQWILIFKPNTLSSVIFVLTMSLLIYWTVSMNTLFYIPIILIYYITGIITFWRDIRKLETFILKELEWKDYY